jgi:hypothetical protein
MKGQKPCLFVSHPDLPGVRCCAVGLQVTLFDVQQRSVLAELSTPPIKYVVWNADMSQVALTSKHAIIIADKRLGNAQTVRHSLAEQLPLVLCFCVTLHRAFTPHEAFVGSPAT